MSTFRFIPLPPRESLSDEALKRNVTEFDERMQRPRTVREFSARPVPRGVIESFLRAAGSAPNGANLQPSHFVAIADPAVKHEIRIAAEEEEREFYEKRAPAQWLEALALLGTDSNKLFLEVAPWLIAISRNRTECDRTARTSNITTRQSPSESPPVFSSRQCTTQDLSPSPTRRVRRPF